MNKPIRVLHVFGRLDAGGAESRTMDIYRTINRRKVQFDFVIHTDDECFFSSEIKSLGGQIYSVPRFNGKNYFRYQKAWDDFFEKNSNYQIVHGHLTNTAFVYLRSAKNNDMPIRISHARNSKEDTRIKEMTAKLSRFYANNYFAVSTSAAKSVFGNKSIKKNKVNVIPNAINASTFIYNEPMRRQKRVELDLQDNFVVGHIGRFHQQKNHEFLLRIFRKIKNEKNNAKLLLVGDGPLRSDLLNQISEKGLEDSVVLTGVRTDVPELLQAIDVLVFPSYSEGYPGVVLESQAAGLPCIISDTITKEIKVTDLVEFLSIKKSPKTWAEKTLEAVKVKKRRNTFNEIRQKGYDIESVSKWYEEFYISQVENYN